MYSLPRDMHGEPREGDAKRGQGNNAIYVARNRFAVLDKQNQVSEEEWMRDRAACCRNGRSIPLQLFPVDFSSSMEKTRQTPYVSFPCLIEVNRIDQGVQDRYFREIGLPLPNPVYLLQPLLFPCLANHYPRPEKRNHKAIQNTR